MGWNHSLICLTCNTDEGIDLETEGEELKEWMIKHWGHKVKIEWYEDGELISKSMEGLRNEKTRGDLYS